MALVVGPEAEGIAERIAVVDKMFDCLNLNVSSLSEGYNKRKLARDLYCHANDWRLEVVTAAQSALVYIVCYCYHYLYSGLKRTVYTTLRNEKGVLRQQLVLTTKQGKKCYFPERL